MPLVIVAVGILALLILIMGLKLNTFISLIIVSFVVALALGMPLMVAALSVTHGFLPPHPGPTGIAVEYGADIGEVLLYGFIISIPTVIIAGPLFIKLAKRLVPQSFTKTGSTLL